MYVLPYEKLLFYQAYGKNVRVPKESVFMLRIKGGRKRDWDCDHKTAFIWVQINSYNHASYGLFDLTLYKIQIILTFFLLVKKCLLKKNCLYIGREKEDSKNFH